MTAHGPRLSLRDAVPSDADGVARVHVRSWQAAYRGLLPDRYLDALRAEDRAASYVFDHDTPERPHTIVALDGEQICGFATIGPTRDADVEGLGELLAIYVDPDWWDRGVGRLLVEEARRRLHTQGFSAAVVWTLAGNDRAERFYLRDGWAPDGAHRDEDRWGVAADEVRYRRVLP